MINVSNAYIQASERKERSSYIMARYGSYDKGAKTDITNIETTNKPFGDDYKTVNEQTYSTRQYISCEPNRVILNGEFCFIQNKNSKQALEDIAYWSNILSNENGLFASNPKIIYTFDRGISFTEITVHFQEVCENFSVKYYNNNSIIATRIISNNSNLEVLTNGVTPQSEVTFNKLEIEFMKTKLPYRYVKFNEIDFGVLQNFYSAEILDMSIIDELSIDSSELSSNSLSLTIADRDGNYDILNPNNKLKYLQERQEITVYHYLKVGQRYKELPLGTFLLKNFKAKEQKLELQAYDDVYFMNKIYYGSKFYENEKMSTILHDLFNYFNYTSFIIDSEIDERDIRLSGYIPNVQFREALRLICEAGRCVVAKTRYGDTYIFQTYDEATKKFSRDLISKELPTKNMFNDVLDVQEYNYSVVEENVELYNSTLGVGQHTILLDKKPVKQDTIVKSVANANYEILVRGATSCIIQVNAETNVVLKGTHVKETSSVRRMKKYDYETISTDYAITRVNNHLVTSENYQSIAQWKFNRGAVKYNFDTLVVPYVEVGDTCLYQTRFGTTNTFIPTRIEFSNSILQKIEGE